MGGMASTGSAAGATGPRWVLLVLACALLGVGMAWWFGVDAASPRSSGDAANGAPGRALPPASSAHTDEQPGVEPTFRAPDRALLVLEGLEGLVVDIEGQPVVDATLTLSPVATTANLTTFDSIEPLGAVWTDERGSFVFPSPLAPGAYEVWVSDHSVLSPAGGLRVGSDRAPVQIVVARRDVEGELRIQGRVVDPEGAPLADVRIGTLHGERGHFDQCLTDTRGRFVLRRSRDLREAVHLVASDESYRHWESPGAVPWSTSDLQIVLHAGPRLALRVVRAGDRTPVERFGHRTLVTMHEGFGGSRWLQGPIEFHPDGLLSFEQLAIGDVGIRLFLPGDAEVCDPVGVRVVHRADRELVVELPTRVERSVRVVDHAGAPLEAVDLELIGLPQGAVCSALGSVAGLEEWTPLESWPTPHLLDASRTDADGRATVSGAPGSQRFAIRLPGPGVVPQLIEPFLLDDDGELLVIASTGAVLTLEFGPPDVLAQLRERAASDPDHAGEDVPLAIWLRTESRGPEAIALAVPGRGVLPIPFGESGRMRVRGIPAGEWWVHLGWGHGERVVELFAWEPIELRVGEERRLQIDLEPLRHQRVHITTLQNGTPTPAWVDFERRRAARREDMRRATTDAAGQATILLPLGSWDAWASFPVEDDALGTRSRTVEVEGSRPLELRFDQQLCVQPLRILDPAGQPVPWSEILQVTAEQPLCGVHPTDGDGRTVLRGAAGPVTLRAVRAPLLDATGAALRRWRSEHRDAGLDDVSVPLFALELAPTDGAAPEIEIRLPAEWLRAPR